MSSDSPPGRSPTEEPPSGAGWVEKTSKYRKAWVTRWLIVRGIDVSYAEGEDKPKKSVLRLRSVTRTAERMKVIGPDNIPIPGSVGEDVLGFELRGEDGERWHIRATEVVSYWWWYDLLRSALAFAKKAPPRHMGLPPQDPRTHLPFVEVLPQYLSRFLLLDKAVIHFFRPVDAVVPKREPNTDEAAAGQPSADPGQRRYEHKQRIVVLGDRFLYLCLPSADIARCIPIQDIHRVIVAPMEATAEATPKGAGTEGRESTTGGAAPSNSSSSKKLAVGVMAPALFRTSEQREAGLAEPSNDMKDELEFSICFYGAEDIMNALLDRLHVCYYYLTMGRKEVTIDEIDNVADMLPQLKLDEPINFANDVVLPTSKKSLADLYRRYLDRQKENPDEEHDAAAQGLSAEETSAMEAKREEGDPLVLFLSQLGLADTYYGVLSRNSVDWEVLACCDDADLQRYGVSDRVHRDQLVAALADKRLVDGVMQQSAAAAEARISGTNKALKRLKVESPTIQDTKTSIRFDDSDDDLLGGNVGAPKAFAGASVDDSDDDLLSPQDSPPGKQEAAIKLDDSDDDLLGPPPPKAATQPPGINDDDL